MSGQRSHAGLLVFFITLIMVGCQVPPTDITTANKEVVREYLAALDAQDFTTLSELLVEDCVIHLPDGTDRVGRDAAFQVIRGFYTSFPDYTHGIEEMIAEGDLVAVRVKYGGTHQGHFLGVAPTGRQVDYAGMFFMTVADGVLTEVWFIDDDLNLMSQLGMEVVPKGLLD